MSPTPMRENKYKKINMIPVLSNKGGISILFKSFSRGGKRPIVP
tara:strand:- start:11 stop:142 length:132 start_codon:yes stop_codon:yes gene_type:complete